MITLKDGDRVVGAVQLSSERTTWCSSPATPSCCGSRAASVRPQGRAAGGMAGVRLSAARPVVWFGAVDAGAARATPSGPPAGDSTAVVVTVAGARAPCRAPGPTASRSPRCTSTPAKGRATGGVRCHRFLKGEDMLVLAWAGPAPAVAATDTGAPVPLPDPVGKRDGSGTALGRQIAVLGGSARVV